MQPGDNHEQEYHERRHVLTPSDLAAIAELLDSAHECRFSSEERVDIKRNVKRINAIANAIGWAVIALVGGGILYLIKLGIIAKGS